MKRLFFALWPDPETRKRIDIFNRRIKGGRLKKVHVDNLHVTLVFLGAVNSEIEADIISQSEKIGIPAFTIEFARLAFWKKPRILCLTAVQYDSQLILLVDTIKGLLEPLGIEIEERAFRPHITLARKATGLIDIEAPCIEWRARSFSLVESCSTPSGVHYQVLRSWELQ